MGTLRREHEEYKIQKVKIQKGVKFISRMQRMMYKFSLALDQEGFRLVQSTSRPPHFKNTCNKITSGDRWEVHSRAPSTSRAT